MNGDGKVQESGGERAADIDGVDGPPSPLWLSEVTFANGLQVDLSPGAIVVLVGPNNVGKSQTLQQLNAKLRRLNIHGFDPIASIRLESRDEGEDGALLNWVQSKVPVSEPVNGTPVYSDASGSNFNRAQINQEARNFRSGTELGSVGRLLTLHANAEGRLGLASQQQPINTDEQPAQNPIQALHNNIPAMTRLSTAFEDAFGSPLTFDAVSGHWSLRIGGPIAWGSDPETGFPSPATREAVRDLPMVHAQGHGVRSYAGLLAELAAARHLFVLVDEPEAFLHPPQARQLGRHLVNVKLAETQVFAATHSATLLRGILEGAVGTAAEVAVVRLTRSVDDEMGATVLQGEDVMALWEDSILRYSNVLEGIFHHSVIICESDSDCALYEAVIQTHDLAPPGRDHMFVHAGGVSRIPVVASALSAVSVDAAAIVDADVLLQPNRIAEIARALYRPLPDEVQEALERTSRDIRQKLDAEEDLTVGALRHDIEEILSDDPDKSVSRNMASEVRRAAESRVASSLVKSHGIEVLRAQQLGQAKELLGRLREHGIFVVPVGELESWFKEVGNHGTRHVATVLERAFHADDERSRALREFLGQVLARFTPG